MIAKVICIIKLSETNNFCQNIDDFGKFDNIEKNLANYNCYNCDNVKL